MEKFLLIHLLISIIFSIVLVVYGNEKSFSPLNSSYIMEAKKRFMAFDITKLVHPPMPSYSFSIYNRHLFENSEFNDYDSLLENKLARSQARAEHLASILENGSVNGTHESKRYKVLKTTSIQFVDGEYLAAFILGTDQTVTRYLLLDTGSDFVWWQCGPCRPEQCYEQKNEPLYDLTKSRTYRKINCRTESTKCISKPNTINCSTYLDTCAYNYEYSDASRTRGWIAEDMITFVSDQSQVRILFGCGRDQKSGTAFSGEFSGIAGIGPRNRAGGYSLPSQFGADIMALCLPEFYSTKSTTLSFNTTPFRTIISARILPNPQFPEFYFVNLFKIFINDKGIPLSHYVRGSFVDTGSTVSSFPPDLYKVFRDTFRKEVRGAPLYNGPLGSFDTCYRVDPGMVPNFPIVKMYFGQQNPENMLVLQQEQVVVHKRGLFCLAFLSWKNDAALIGSYQLQRIGLTFNAAANILSFDLNAC